MPADSDAALAELCDAIERCRSLLGAAAARAGVLQAERAKGRSFAEIVAAEDRPLVVEMLTSVLDELAAAGSAFRRAEARALHRDGLSQDAIAALFGVSRQRVGALLAESRG